METGSPIETLWNDGGEVFFHQGALVSTINMGRTYCPADPTASGGATRKKKAKTLGPGPKAYRDDGGVEWDA